MNALGLHFVSLSLNTLSVRRLTESCDMLGLDKGIRNELGVLLIMYGSMI